MSKTAIHLLLALITVLCLCNCGHSDDDNGPILPGGDEDDRVLNEPSRPAVQPAAVGCQTYSSYGFRNGRQAWKIYKPLWRYYSRASVLFSSGYYVPTVYMAKANRIHTGDGR